MAIPYDYDIEEEAKDIKHPKCLLLTICIGLPLEMLFFYLI